jgi:O-antigen/teichoic acid export membrane protein
MRDLSEPAHVSSSGLIRRVLLGAASNYIGKVITLGTWLFLTPFILHQLGPSDYGLWVLTGSVVSYGSLLDLGIAGAIVKYVAEHRARGEYERGHAVVATALLLYLGLGALVLLASAMCAPLFPAWFHIAESDAPRARWLVLLMGASVALSLPGAAVNALLQGLQRYDLANLVTTGGVLLSALAAVIALNSGGGLVLMVAANIPVAVAALVVGLLLSRRAAPDLRPGFAGGARSLVRPILSFSWSVFVLRAATYLQARTDEIVIGVFLPVSAIAPYSIAHRLSDLTSTATEQLLKVFPALASELHARDEPARLKLFYTSATRLSLAIAVPVGCTLVMLAKPILTAWVGAEFADHQDLVVVLTLAAVVDLSVWPAGAVLQGMARHRPLAPMALAAGIANLVISIVLVTRLGPLGVAIGTLIPAAFEVSVLVLPYTLRAVRMSVRRWMREVLVPVLGPVLPQGLVLGAASYALPTMSVPVLVGVASAGLLVYATAYLALGAGGVERRAGAALFSGLLNTRLGLGGRRAPR